MIIIDTGAFLAILNHRDPNHQNTKVVLGVIGDGAVVRRSVNDRSKVTVTITYGRLLQGKRSATANDSASGRYANEMF